MGFINVRISVNTVIFLAFEGVVIDANVPLFVGLEFIDGYEVSLDLARNKIISQNIKLEIKLTRKNVQFFIVWYLDTDKLFTVDELHKSHRHFYYSES